MTPAYQKISLTSFDLEKINQAVAYITDHPDRELNSQSIAQAINISEHKLKAGFKHKYQMPLQQFITKARMEAATTLLQTTDLPVKTVAGNVGYKNMQYFITTFKKYYGKTPGSFRRQAVLSGR